MSVEKMNTHRQTPESKPLPTPVSATLPRQVSRSSARKQQRFVSGVTAQDPMHSKTQVGTQVSEAYVATEHFIKRMLKGRTHTVLGALIGLLSAILLLWLGLFRTLIICFMVLIGIVIGQVMDGNPKLLKLLQSFLTGRSS